MESRLTRSKLDSASKKNSAKCLATSAARRHQGTRSCPRQSRRSCPRERPARSSASECGTRAGAKQPPNLNLTQREVWEQVENNMFQIPSLALRINPGVWGWAVGQHALRVPPTAPFPHAVKKTKRIRCQNHLNNLLRDLRHWHIHNLLHDSFRHPPPPESP